MRAVYNDKIASSSDNFEIVSSKVTNKEKIYIVIIVILAVIPQFDYLPHNVAHEYSWNKKKRVLKKGTKRRKSQLEKYNEK